MTTRPCAAAPDGAGMSAIAGHVTVPAWLNSLGVIRTRHENPEASL